MSTKAWWPRVVNAALLIVGLQLGLGRPPLKAQERPLSAGERVRVWLGPPTAPAGVPRSLQGKLMAAQSDTLKLGIDYQYVAVPRAAVIRVERSLGRPHAWRNAGIAFLVSSVAASVVMIHRCSEPRGDDVPTELCAAVGMFFVGLPVSGLAALTAHASATERYEPARLPDR